MNYIVFDLEFNQNFNCNTEDENIKKNCTNERNLTFEIIQIGAIKLNENFQKVSTFNFLVKPVIHKTLHPYVENMTKIDINKANSSQEFPEIYKNFINFIGSDESILCVWGLVDISELINNLNYYKITTDDLPSKYLDIQYHASKLLNYKKGTRVGLKPALELLNINHNDDFHDAFNDAYYTSKIFKNIYNSDMKIQKYNHSQMPGVKRLKTNKFHSIY